jgi:hypothetical protein
MSVKVMTMVWERYPDGGGDMLLALALADHSHDDGTHIYPSVDSLAKKTRQSVRTVQYQLGRMKEAGWLIATNAGDGGRGRHAEYRISPDWLNGAEIARAKKGASDDAKGCNPRQERVQSDARKGATAIAPANNQEESSLEPSGNRSASRRRAKRADTPLSAWLDACKESGERPIPEDDTIFEYAEKVKLPIDFIRYAWLEFKRRHIEDDSKKYKDWRAAFRNAVRENWYKLWFQADDGNWLLTTRGKQVKQEHSEGA